MWQINRSYAADGLKVCIRGEKLVLSLCCNAEQQTHDIAIQLRSLDGIESTEWCSVTRPWTVANTVGLHLPVHQSPPGKCGTGTLRNNLQRGMHLPKRVTPPL